MRRILIEVSGDFAVVVDAALNHRRGIDLMIEDNRHAMADVGLGKRPEASSRCGGKLEVNLILRRIVGIRCGSGSAQIRSGHCRSTIENVIDRRGSWPGR